MTKHREVTTDIILVDIINFSILNSKQQLEIISFLTKSYRNVIQRMLLHPKIRLETLVLGFIPTGDGFYCILNPKYKGYGSILGLSFNHFSDQISKIYPYFQGIRIAVHTGGVNQFTDILGHKNFIGDGLNDCARYLSLKDFTISTVIVSDSAYENLKHFLSERPDYEELLRQREFKRSDSYFFMDKHNIERKGYRIWLRKSGIITPPK